MGQPGGAYAKREISLRRRFGEDMNLTIGANNLFDGQPPYISTSGVTRFPNLRLTSQYDVVGRRFFARVQKAF